MLGHIVRCEGRKTMGWQVRIPTGQPRKYTSKLFSDSTFGGKKKALAAAETYLAANALSDDARPGYFAGKGVFRTRDDKGIWYWAASFIDGPTKTNFKIFRESVYGPEKAKMLATAYRRAWEKAFDAAETDRFFAGEYPVQATWQPQYYLSANGGAHIQRDAVSVWCGRDLRDWEETGMLESLTVCRQCQAWLDKYLSLGNLLLHYGVIKPEDLVL